MAALAIKTAFEFVCCLLSDEPDIVIAPVNRQNITASSNSRSLHFMAYSFRFDLFLDSLRYFRGSIGWVLHPLAVGMCMPLLQLPQVWQKNVQKKA